MYKSFFLFLLLLFTLNLTAQVTAEVGKKQYFPKTVSPGNYSGIARIEKNRYIMVSDKGKEDGFYLTTIDTDSVTGELLNVCVDSFVSVGTSKRDVEGVVFLPHTQTVLLTGEKDQRIIEYRLNGEPTGRELVVPEYMKKSRGNYGFEALAYHPETHLIWTTTESTLTLDGKAATATNGVRNRLRLLSFSEDFKPHQSYAYEMDAPSVRKKARIYALGVSEMVALPDGSLLVLEREVFIPKKKLGAFCQCKLYQVFPQQSIPHTDYTSRADKQELDTVTISASLDDRKAYLSKTLICQWKSKVNLLHQDFANMEGACLGPMLTDGSQLLILCADSQNQKSGILRDWFMPIILRQQKTPTH